MRRGLLEPGVKAVRSLRKADVPRSVWNALSGPYTAGRTEPLRAFRSLADVINTDPQISGRRRHREAGAPSVLAEAVAPGCLVPPLGRNRWWSLLPDDAVDCCRSHLTVARRDR